MFSRELILISLQIVNCFLFIFEASEITEIVLVSVNIFISLLHQMLVYKRINFYHYLSKMILIIQSILAFSVITSPHFLFAETLLQISLQICIIGKLKNIQYDFITYVVTLLLIGILNQLKFENTATQMVRIIVISFGLIFLFVFFINKQEEVQTTFNEIQNQEQVQLQLKTIENQYSISYDTNLQLINISDQLKNYIDRDFLQKCMIIQYEPPLNQILSSEISLKEMLEIIIKQNQEICITVIQCTHSICDAFQLRIHYNLLQIQLDFFPTKERDSILMKKYLKTILSQLFNTFSHEFGTALNYISAFSQVGCDCGNTETFREIHNVCQIMHHFVLNLTDFNDIQNKKFSLQVQPIDISQLLEDIRRLFQKQLFNKGLQLDCYNFTSSQSIVSDRRRIFQILIQIIQNAQKFTLHGGVKVVITQVKQNLIQFIVEDTGIGINDEVKLELKQLFQSNVKLANKISENTAGFGLGCYLSNLIAQHLSELSYSEGGGLQIDQLEQGSRISFVVKNTELPVYISNSSSIQKISSHLYYDNRQNLISSQIKINMNTLLSQYKKSSLTKQRVSLLEANMQHQQIMSLVINDESDETDYFKRIKYLCNVHQLKKSATPLSLRDLQFSEKYMNNCNCISVLIVDDEMINIIALQLMLKSLDIQSDFCFNGQEALNKIEHNLIAHCKYSVVFMDINMPVMDGFKATQIIREKYQHIFDIIACTAFSDAETQIKCQQCGMNHYLNKPVNLNQLFYLMEVLKL